MGFVNFNGTVYSADEPIFNAQNRAFKYGDGLFESMRLIGGGILFLDLHLNRLLQGLEVLGIEKTQDLEITNLKTLISELAAQNGNVRNAFIRLTVFRGGSGKYQSNSNSNEWLLELTPLELNRYELNQTGLKVDIYPELKVVQNKLASFKTLNALPYVLAANYARHQRLDDCLLLNDLGQVCEATSSNVFIIRDNRVIGVQPESGAVRGILQSVLPDVCQKKSVKIDFETILLEDLLEADEMFLTNAVNGIRWVSDFRTTSYTNEKCTELVCGLNELVDKQTNSEVFKT